MSGQPTKIDAEKIGKLFAEKFKNLPKDANLAKVIPAIIMEIIDSCGIVIPEVVKAKIEEFQINK
ncbi:MAG TPA: hypothetical protein VIM29_03500 [Bacillota bacterium]